jgi:predicted SnoaL-like aldol condensation-catalyzing enzyme
MKIMLKWRISNDTLMERVLTPEIRLEMIQQKPPVSINVSIKDQEDCVRDFIERIWNEGIFSEMGQYLHQDFIDHSMPFHHFKNENGLLFYLQELSRRVRHHAVIVDLVVINNFILLDTRIHVTLVQSENEGEQYSENINAMRLFRMEDGKIKEHWEFID